MLLEAAGFDVTEAGDGSEALRALRAEGADLVLCDLFMPDTDGLEVIRAVRRQVPGVPVIAMSGGGAIGAVDLLPVALHLGAAGVLYKPLDRVVTLATMDRVLRAAR